MTMPITEVTSAELSKLNESLVIIGCDVSTPETRAGFINGVTEHLVSEKAVAPGYTTPEQLFSSIHSYKPNDLTSLVFVMKPEAFVMGRLAIVRLSLPDCKWLSDFLDRPLSHR